MLHIVFLALFFCCYIYTHPSVSKQCGTSYYSLFSLLNLLEKETVSTCLSRELLSTHYRTQTHYHCVWVISNVMWNKYIGSSLQMYTEWN